MKLAALLAGRVAKGRSVAVELPGAENEAVACLVTSPGKASSVRDMSDLLKRIEACNREDEAKRRMAVSRLIEVIATGADAIVPLIQALTDSRHRIREAAAVALGRIPAVTDEVVRSLVQALGDEREEVRKRATESLALAGTRALPVLMTALEHENPNVQARAAIVLGQIGPPARRALAPLVPLLSHPDGFVWREAAMAVGRIGVPDLAGLIKGLYLTIDQGAYPLAEALVVALRETEDRSDNLLAALWYARARGRDSVKREALIGIKRIDRGTQVRHNLKSDTIRVSGRSAAAFFRAILGDE